MAYTEYGDTYNRVKPEEAGILKSGGHLTEGDTLMTVQQVVVINLVSRSLHDFSVTNTVPFFTLHRT